MAALEDVQRVIGQIIADSAKGDFSSLAAALDDDLEVFDTVPYRFDSRASFLDYVQSLAAGTESMTFAFHQPSCRLIADDVAVVNAYDRMTAVPKGAGAPRVQSGRTTLVLARRGGQWKIVSGHFSAMPRE
jgi:uncharacterized protein (TIGR02246 family)